MSSPASAKVYRFKQVKVPKQENERARVKVIQGPDYGVVYIIADKSITMGRGETCDIMLSDLKASRLHAELSYTGTGWNIRDLGSSNGILFKNKEVRSMRIRSGEAFTIGETTLEFFSADVAEVVLASPPRTMEQLKTDQAQVLISDKRIKAITSLGGMARNAAANEPKKKSPNWVVLAVAGVGAFVIYEADFFTLKSTTPSVKPSPEVRDIANFLPGNEPTAEIKKTADMFFKAGFREYREGNYLRAISHFRTVLQVQPGHRLANLYLKNCEKSIEDEVKFHLEHGKKGFTSGKLRESKGHFESVTRLLYRDPTHPAYVEAKEQLGLLEKALKGDG